MNDRERYLAALLFQQPDRVPFIPGTGRKSTRENWYKQGLPEGVTDYNGYVRQILGMEPASKVKPIDLEVDFRMIPQFEEKVLERRPAPPGSTGPGSLVVQDWKGNICEISDEFDVSYLRLPVDFVTRSWIKCPVENRADWEDMKSRYNISDPKRFPADLAQRGKQLKDRTYVSTVHFSGPFWQLREWLGFENLCMLFMDDPAFAQEMVDFWEVFIAQALEKIFQHHVPDVVHISEDMAYKVKPMIGPDMCRQFLFRCWKTWGDLCKSYGVPIYAIDSDGYVGDLIPVWIDAGLHVNDPLEVAAGNDLPAYRKQYGTKMAYRGGVDKRAMAKGGKVLCDEMARLAPVVKAGGYIPGCDHGIPSDVSWPNFVEYCRLLAQATGWL